MSIKKINRIYLIGAVFLAVFLLSNKALAQEDIKLTADIFINQLNKEIDTLNTLDSELNSSSAQNANFIKVFRNQITKYKSILDESLNVYRKIPITTYAEFNQAVVMSISGSQTINSSLTLMDQALVQGSKTKLDTAINQYEQGINALNNSGTKYTSFSNKYNAEVAKTNNETGLNNSSVEDGSTVDTAFGATIGWGIPLLMIYIYLLVVGYLLSKRFKSKLNRLLEGKIAGGKFTGTGFYGLHLILLYPYLYILLLFSVLLVWDFASLLIMLVSILPRIPIALLIAIPVVVISSIWAIIKGFIGSKKTKDLSIPITSKEQPDIWSICDGVAREVGTRPLDKIMLSPNSGIGVHLEGGLFRLFIGRTKRVLTIGLPSISNITYSEMKAILAHEFGHFSNKDTAWSSFTYTMAASLQNTLAVMPSPQKTEGSNYLTVVSALNPALWVLLGYKFMFQVFTSGFSRMREVFADKTAISLYGYKNFTDGLMKIARNDYVFSQYFTNKLIEMMRESGQVYTNIYQFMEETNQSLGKDGKKILDNVESEILNEEKASKFDSHPLLRERLGYAKQFEVESKYKTEKKLFSQAFKRWDTVSKEMSDLYTYFIGTLIGYKFNQAEQTNNTNQ